MDQLKLYIFKPTDDITVQELANIMKVLFVSLIEGIQGKKVSGVDNLEIDAPIYNNLTPELKKYFIEK